MLVMVALTASDPDHGPKLVTLSRSNQAVHLGVGCTWLVRLENRPGAASAPGQVRIRRNYIPAWVRLWMIWCVLCHQVAGWL